MPDINFVIARIGTGGILDADLRGFALNTGQRNVHHPLDVPIRDIVYQKHRWLKLIDLDVIPRFPSIAAQLLEESQSPNVEIQKIVGLVECEAAIAAKVLQIANSPLYSPSRPIETIKHAVVLLGYKSIANVALSVASQELFVANSALHDKLFIQSLSVASHASILASTEDDSIADEVFLCGILHDIGKLAFLVHDPENYPTLLDKGRDGETVVYELENYGVSHAEIGKECVIKWGLPHSIATIIGNHHTEFANVLDCHSRYIIAGNYFARKWQHGFDELEVVGESKDIENYFAHVELDQIVEQCREQFASLSEICMS